MRVIDDAKQGAVNSANSSTVKLQLQDVDYAAMVSSGSCSCWFSCERNMRLYKSISFFWLHLSGVASLVVHCLKGPLLHHFPSFRQLFNLRAGKGCKVLSLAFSAMLLLDLGMGACKRGLQANELCVNLRPFGEDY